MRNMIISLLVILLLSSFATATLNDAEVYYSFDESDVSGTILIDATDTSNGTCVGMTGDCNTDIGKVINSTDFVPQADYINTNWGGSQLTNTFTISAWVKADTLTDNPNGIFTTISKETNRDGVTLGHHNIGGWRMLLFSGNSAVINEDEGSITASTGTWYNTVLTYNGTTAKLYVNNVLTLTGTGTIATTYHDTDVHIGRQYSTVANNGWDGNIDEFGVYNRVLSISEISNLYNGGNGVNSYNLNIFSNVSNYAATLIRDDFKVQVNYTTANASAYCGVTDNSTNLTCGTTILIGGTSVVDCNISTGDFIREIVELIPYCSDTVNINRVVQDVNLNNYRLNVTATDGLTGLGLTNIVVNYGGVNQQDLGDFTEVWLSDGTKELKIRRDGYGYVLINVTFSDTPQNLAVVLFPINSVTVSAFDIDGNVLNDTILTINGQINNTNETTPNNVFNGDFAVGSLTIVAEKTGYVDSTYYGTLVSNSFFNISAYLESDLIAIGRTFTVKLTADQTNVQNALLSFYRTINSTQTLVTQSISDFNGESLVFLDPTENYLLRVSHSGYLSKEVSFTPTQTSYTVYLGTGFVPEFTNIFDDISYNTNPYYTTLTQNTSYIFNFSISSSLGSLEYWGLTVNNSGVITISNKTTSPAGSMTSLNITTGINSTQHLPVIVTYFFKRAGKDEWTYSKNYIAIPVLEYGNFTIMSAFGNFSESLDSGEMSSLTKYIIITFTTIGIVGLIIMGTGVAGLWLVGIMTVIILSFWAYIGWLAWWLWGLFVVPIILLELLKLKEKI